MQWDRWNRFGERLRLGEQGESSAATLYLTWGDFF